MKVAMLRRGFNCRSVLTSWRALLLAASVAVASACSSGTKPPLAKISTDAAALKSLQADVQSAFQQLQPSEVKTDAKGRKYIDNPASFVVVTTTGNNPSCLGHPAEASDLPNTPGSQVK